MDVQFHCLLSQKCLQIVLCTHSGAIECLQILAREPARFRPSYHLARAELLMLARLAYELARARQIWLELSAGSARAGPSRLASRLGLGRATGDSEEELPFLFYHF
jgi:hypothetical protein